MIHCSSLEAIKGSSICNSTCNLMNIFSMFTLQKNWIIDPDIRIRYYYDQIFKMHLSLRCPIQTELDKNTQITPLIVALLVCTWHVYTLIRLQLYNACVYAPLRWRMTPEQIILSIAQLSCACKHTEKWMCEFSVCLNWNCICII